MGELSKLTPRGIWEWFEAVTRVPRPSKKEEKIIAFLEDFAKTHGIPYKKDAVGNIVMTKAASPGMEDRPGVILQSHMDMVCEKNSGVDFDFDNDPIRVRIEDGWVRAEGTTLGADDGIGMAAAMAVLLDDTLRHGPVEALFTVDEETGLTGAFNLGKGMITGKYLINLDSEDEGEVFIGCAGGIDTIARFPYREEAAPQGYRFYRIAVSGLKGGHSGDDIEKGRGNSNRILARLLLVGLDDHGLRLSKIDGGNLRNAIPREAWAVAAVAADKADGFEALFGEFADDIRNELQYTDQGVELKIEESAPDKVLDTASARNLVYALAGLPNGVQAMSFAMEGLVETSTNLASVKMADGAVVVTTSQRSSVESAKRAVADAVRAVFALARAEVRQTDGYPGWAPDPGSHLLEVAEKAYERLFGTKARIRAIHAGLECGLFLEKHPHLEMVSIGPTLRGVHSPDERLEISTVDKFWRLLVEMLANI